MLQVLDRLQSGRVPEAAQKCPFAQPRACCRCGHLGAAIEAAMLAAVAVDDKRKRAAAGMTLAPKTSRRSAFPP
jgi:hypothetical protein